MAAGPEQGKARLAYAYPRLEGYLNWDIRNRGDTTGKSPLLYWTKGTESGMDNSQRFDDGKQRLAVDFSVFLAREADLLSKIAGILGNATGESHWANVSKTVSTAIHNQLWNPKTQFYHDRAMGLGDFSTVKAITGFLPMWLPDFPKYRLSVLLQHLNDTKLFNSAASIPTVSLDTHDFSTDMWRGPMWINTNYFVILALRLQGETDLAKALTQATIAPVEKYYSAYGVFFEFYDSKDEHDPRDLLRKGHRSGGVRDYHWSAALVYRLLLDQSD